MLIANVATVNATIAPIIDRLFRIVMSGLVVPLLVVAGLLSVPTICKCGAQLPHDHSIFGLADHTHGPSDAVGDDSTEFDDGQPGVRAPSPGATIGTLNGALSVQPILDEIIRNAELLSDADSRLDGLAAILEPPPPRV